MPRSLRVGSCPLRGRLPLTARRPGIDEIAGAVGEARSVLDVGCGSGRLTVALAERGRDVTGIDLNQRQLEEAGKRAQRAGVPVRFLHADMTGPLPFSDGEFGATVSRLSLMIPDDPVAILVEVARTVIPGGTIVSAVWAHVDENPWFTAPRAAVARALGGERAAFARHFGKLGTVEELADVHRSAGLTDVRVEVLRDDVAADSVAEHWAYLTETIGHYTRLAGSLTPEEADRLEPAVCDALTPYRAEEGLRLPRTMLMAVARR